MGGNIFIHIQVAYNTTYPGSPTVRKWHAPPDKLARPNLASKGTDTP